jgi:glc operon protein GlcG
MVQLAPSPPALPEKMPFDIPYGMPITLDRAKQLIAAAEAEAKKHDWKMNITIADPHGELVAFEHMDGAQYPSILISQNKARTAARWRRETRIFYKLYDVGKDYYGTLDPQLAASPGGLPLVDEGKIIGGIGCSGGTGDQDEVVAKAGLAALK